MLPAGSFELSTLTYQDGVLAIDRADRAPAAVPRDEAAARQAGTTGLVLAPSDTGWKIAPARLADRVNAAERARVAAGPKP